MACSPVLASLESGLSDTEHGLLKLCGLDQIISSFWASISLSIK